jgi:hypothetical protein
MQVGAELRIGVGQILRGAFGAFGAVDSDDDEGTDVFGLNEPGEGFVHAPFFANKRRGANIEQILAVVEIENGIASALVLFAVVSGREKDAQATNVLEGAAGEGPDVEIGRAGAFFFIVWRRPADRILRVGRSKGRKK